MDYPKYSDYLMSLLSYKEFYTDSKPPKCITTSGFYVDPLLLKQEREFYSKQISTLQQKVDRYDIKDKTDIFKIANMYSKEKVRSLEQVERIGIEHKEDVPVLYSWVMLQKATEGERTLTSLDCNKEETDKPFKVSPTYTFNGRRTYTRSPNIQAMRKARYRKVIVPYINGSTDNTVFIRIDYKHIEPMFLLLLCNEESIIEKIRNKEISDLYSLFTSDKISRDEAKIALLMTMYSKDDNKTSELLSLLGEGQLLSYIRNNDTFPSPGREIDLTKHKNIGSALNEIIQTYTTMFIFNAVCCLFDLLNELNVYSIGVELNMFIHDEIVLSVDPKQFSKDKWITIIKLMQEVLTKNVFDLPLSLTWYSGRNYADIKRRNICLI